MPIIQKIFSVATFFLHLLTARNTKGFGVHSPFIFDYCQFVVRNKYSYYLFKPIEEERKKYLQDNTTIQIIDMGTGNDRSQKIADIAKSALKSVACAQLLFRTVNYLQPKNILELGTSLGITTSYLASPNRKATCLTLEGNATTAQLAKQHFAHLHLENIVVLEGDINDTLYSALERLGQLDFAFIDANHSYTPVLCYFEECLNYTHDNTVIVVDDIYWSAGMNRAWKKIKQNPKVISSINFYYFGILFFNPTLPPKHYKMRI